MKISKEGEENSILKTLRECKKWKYENQKITIYIPDDNEFMHSACEYLWQFMDTHYVRGRYQFPTGTPTIDITLRERHGFWDEPGIWVDNTDIVTSLGLMTNLVENAIW